MITKTSPRRRLTTPITVKLRTGLIDAIRTAASAGGTTVSDIASALLLDGMRTRMSIAGVYGLNELSPDDLAGLFSQAQAHLAASSAKVRDDALAEIVGRTTQAVTMPALSDRLAVSATE